MGYCTIEDVQANRPHHPINATSKPNSVYVMTQIEALSAQVNGRLAALGFIVPVLQQYPISFSYLKAAVAWGVAGLIEDGQRAGHEDNQGQTVRTHYFDLYEAMIAKIEEDKSVLSDAPEEVGEEGSQGIRMESFFTQYPEDDPETGQTGRLEGTAVPRFSIRQEF